MIERRSKRRTEAAHSALHTAAGEAVTVVHLAAEYFPYARTGGLAEAVAGLARFQALAGIRTMAIMPLYRTAREVAGELEPVGEAFTVQVGPRLEQARLLREVNPRPGGRIHFIEHDGYFDRERIYGDAKGDYQDNPERFAFFALAAVAALPRLTTGPILLHAHDWHSALAVVYLRTYYGGLPWFDAIRSVLSVHNAGYQGHWRPEILPLLGIPWELYNYRQLEWYDQVNVLKGGLVNADAVVTVSPNHANELRTTEGGFGLHAVFNWLGDRFVGIVNGIDQKVWDPTGDPHIALPFSREDCRPKVQCKLATQRAFSLPENPTLPLFGMAARLVTQKGIDIILKGTDLFDLDAQYVFLGAGEPRFEHALTELSEARPDRVAVNTKFTDHLEHVLMAGADICLMPCQYEPCGLTQMRAQRYGVIPVARRVGGLADTIDDSVTGFLFDEYGSEPLVGAALRALDRYVEPDEWNRIRLTAMGRDFSWERSVERYFDVYRRVIGGEFRSSEVP